MDKRATKIEHLFNKLNGNTRKEWEYKNQEGHNFYLDNQLSRDEEIALKNQGMPTFTINRIIPVVEMLNYYVTEKDPKWQAVATEGSDSKVAAIHSDMADYIWYNSKGSAVYNQIVTDCLTKSIGYFRVRVDANADHGMGEVVFDSIEPFDVYPDPKSRDLLFRDAGYILIYKQVLRSHLLNDLPEFSAKLKKASGQGLYNVSGQEKSDGNDFQYNDISESWKSDGERDDILSYYEMYEKVKVAYRNVFYKMQPTQEEIDAITQQIDQDMQSFIAESQVKLEETIMAIGKNLEDGVIIQSRHDLEVQKAQQEAEQQLQQERQNRISSAMEEAGKVEQTVVSEKEFKILMKGELKNNLVEAIKFYDNKVKVTVCVGGEFLYERYLPGTEYPIIPVHYKYTGTPYPMSVVSPLVGKQKELNKAHQLMIHNASLGSSLRWIAYDGSIDKDHWEKFATAPGAILPVNHGYDPPTAVQPAPISTAFANIVDRGKMDIEHLAGIYSSMQGDTSSQPETYRGLLANDEYGTRRVKAWITNSIHPALQQFGLVVRDYAQATYKINKVFRIVQPNAIAQQDEYKDVEINKMLYNDYGKEIGMYNDYASAKFDVRVVPGTGLPVNRWAYLGELKELLQLGVVDDMAVLAETDIRDKEKIAQRKSMYSQLQGRVQGLEKEIKSLNGDNETLRRQVIQAGIKDAKRSVEHDMRKNLLDSSTKLKSQVAEEKVRQMGITKEMDGVLKDQQKEMRAQKTNNLQATTK
jgi:hypothetical protein